MRNVHTSHAIGKYNRISQTKPIANGMNSKRSFSDFNLYQLVLYPESNANLCAFFTCPGHIVGGAATDVQLQLRSNFMHLISVATIQAKFCGFPNNFPSSME